MSFPCPQGIANIPLECVKKHAESTWPCPRDACDGAEEGGKSAQIAFASDCQPDPRIGLAILICRARDVARTTLHARHVTHDTITARARCSGATS